MGSVEVADQAAGVEFLARDERRLVDANRVGITGWSYGGYMTLMCLAQRPEVFHAGVVGAPVTSWDGYDTCYTERYMATPQTNPRGYRDGSVFEHLVHILGKLMLVHGLVDENVHFRHTARLINELVTSGIPHDVVIFPSERHGVRTPETRRYLDARLADFFRTHVLHRVVEP